MDDSKSKTNASSNGNKQIMEFVCDKVLNIDTNSNLLEKSLKNLKKDDLLRLNVQSNGLTFVLQCKLVNKNVNVFTEPYNFSNLIDDEIEDYGNILSTIQTLGEVNIAGGFVEKGSAMKTNRKSDEELTLHLLQNNNNNTGCFNTSTVVTLDEASSQKLDKLADLNQKMLNLSEKMERKNATFLRQNEKIVENHLKQDSHFKKDIFKKEVKAVKRSSFFSTGSNNSSTNSFSNRSASLDTKVNNNSNLKNIDNKVVFHLNDNRANRHYSENDDIIMMPSFEKESTIGARKKDDKSTGRTQKDFNSTLKSCIAKFIPQEDQNLSILEICEKYPAKINIIKDYLKNHIPKNSTFDSAWSKALNSMRKTK